MSDWLIQKSIIQLKPTRQYPVPVVTSCVVTAEPVNTNSCVINILFCFVTEEKQQGMLNNFSCILPRWCIYTCMLHVSVINHGPAIGSSDIRSKVTVMKMSNQYQLCCMYTEHKKKCNRKFDIEFQNNHWLYLHNFSPHESLISLWSWYDKALFCFLKVVTKKVVITQYPMQNPKKKTLPKVCNFQTKVLKW